MLAPEVLPIERYNNPPLANPYLPNTKILVVDDEPLICQLYSEFLTETGFEVDAAPDGASAWNALQSKDYDLVITDNRMPVLSGMELLMKIHHTRMTVPVILASGTPPLNDFAQRPWLRPAVVLIKPYSPTELMEAVRQVLNTVKSI